MRDSQSFNKDKQFEDLTELENLHLQKYNNVN